MRCRSAGWAPRVAAARLRPGPGLHGDERVLRQPRRGRVDRHHPSRARPRRDLPRHRRHLRPVHQRGAGGRAIARPPRRGVARHQVRHRTDAASDGTARRQRPPRLRARGLRGVPEAPGRRRTSTCTTSTASIRNGARSRRPSARWRSWCARARCAISACRRPRPATLQRAHGCIRSPRCRASTRCGPATPEAEVLPPCRELGIGFVPYSPLGRGFLSGAVPAPAEDFAAGDLRPNSPRFQGENFRRNLELVERSPTWRGQGLHARQLALAWVLAQGDDIVPIPGTKPAPLAR